MSLTNPKVLLFYFALLPLFFRPPVTAVSLGSMVVCVTGIRLLWQGTLVVGGNAAARWLASLPSARSLARRLAGIVFIGFAVKLFALRGFDAPSSGTGRGRSARRAAPAAARRSRREQQRVDRVGLPGRAAGGQHLERRRIQRAAMPSITSQRSAPGSAATATASSSENATGQTASRRKIRCGVASSRP